MRSDSEDSKYSNCFEFHHIGYVCEDIDEFKRSFLTFSSDNDFYLTHEDKQNNVKVGFIRLPAGPNIELIETLDSNIYSPIKNFIDRNGSGFHHICFEAKEIKKALYQLKRDFIPISKSNTGFENRIVYFFIPKDVKKANQLIEIISTPGESYEK